MSPPWPILEAIPPAGSITLSSVLLRDLKLHLPCNILARVVELILPRLIVVETVMVASSWSRLTPCQKW